jgi:DNA-binding IclR family transcriptional regulator
MPIIQSLERALAILELFDENTTELKMTEISARTGLHKSTAHSLLKTLQMYNYMSQDEDSGKYRLGLKLLEKGQLLLQGMDIRTTARKHLESLSAATGYTTHLVVLDGKEGIYIDKVEGEKAVIRYSRIGRRVALHSSAVGKVLAAYRSANELELLLQDYEFSKRTEWTIPDKASFLQELASVREKGYAVDDEENEPGVRCAAVPVYNYAGETAAAISLSTMKSGCDEEQLLRLIGLLQNEAACISRLLGYKAKAAE